MYELNITTGHDSKHHRSCEKKAPHLVVASQGDCVHLTEVVLFELEARLDDLRIPPGNRLESLKGGRIGQYSIRINEQWRVCFRWTKAGAEDVEIVDYH